MTAELSDAGFEVSAQVPVALTDRARVVDTNEPLVGVGMRPDLVIQKNGRTVAVADVKSQAHGRHRRFPTIPAFIGSKVAPNRLTCRRTPRRRSLCRFRADGRRSPASGQIGLPRG